MTKPSIAKRPFQVSAKLLKPNRVCVELVISLIEWWSLTHVRLPQLINDMTNSTQSRFGFSNFAETWNGRLAMLGFVIGLGTELLTGQGILSQLSL